MGRFGRYVIDADGHGGEPLGWRTRIAPAHRATMRAYVDAMRAKYNNFHATFPTHTAQNQLANQCLSRRVGVESEVELHTNSRGSTLL